MLVSPSSERKFTTVPISWYSSSLDSGSATPARAQPGSSRGVSRVNSRMFSGAWKLKSSVDQVSARALMGARASSRAAARAAVLFFQSIFRSNGIILFVDFPPPAGCVPSHYSIFSRPATGKDMNKILKFGLSQFAGESGMGHTPPPRRRGTPCRGGLPFRGGGPASRGPGRGLLWGATQGASRPTRPPACVKISPTFCRND